MIYVVFMRVINDHSKMGLNIWCWVCAEILAMSCTVVPELDQSIMHINRLSDSVICIASVCLHVPFEICHVISEYDIILVSAIYD